jgi:hypothetical protein
LNLRGWAVVVVVGVGWWVRVGNAQEQQHAQDDSLNPA